MDNSRKFDLEQLAEMLKGKNSPRAKQEIEETMRKLIAQSAPITSLRERLVNATRAGDTREIRRIQMHIHNVRQRETNGREF